MEPSDKPVVDQSEDCEEKPAKKIKLADGKEENEAAAAPAVVVDTEEDAAVEAGAKPDEPHCLVCMEPDNPDSPLQKHHCPQCVENAWLICVCCNEALLSRTCPVCRGNYAPIVMHPMPGMYSVHHISSLSPLLLPPLFYYFPFGFSLLSFLFLSCKSSPSTTCTLLSSLSTS